MGIHELTHISAFCVRTFPENGGATLNDSTKRNVAWWSCIISIAVFLGVALLRILLAVFNRQPSPLENALFSILELILSGAASISAGYLFSVQGTQKEQQRFASAAIRHLSGIQDGLVRLVHLVSERRTSLGGNDGQPDTVVVGEILAHIQSLAEASRVAAESSIDNWVEMSGLDPAKVHLQRRLEEEKGLLQKQLDEARTAGEDVESLRKRMAELEERTQHVGVEAHTSSVLATISAYPSAPLTRPPTFYGGYLSVSATGDVYSDLHELVTELKAQRERSSVISAFGTVEDHRISSLVRAVEKLVEELKSRRSP